jgi:hypothetical protein
MAPNAAAGRLRHAARRSPGIVAREREQQDQFIKVHVLYDVSHHVRLVVPCRCLCSKVSHERCGRVCGVEFRSRGGGAVFASVVVL